MHAFSSESIPPRGLSLTHLAGKGLLVACHGHEAEKLAGMARIYIYPEPDLRPAYQGLGGALLFIERQAQNHRHAVRTTGGCMHAAHAVAENALTVRGAGLGGGLPFQ